MTAAVIDTFTGSSGAGTTGSATLTITVPRAVAAGTVIVLATQRDDATGMATGIASIADTRGNTWAIRDAAAQRSGVVEVAWHHAHITVALQAGDHIVVTWNGSPSRKQAVAHVVSGLAGSSVLDATSGGALPAVNTNTGPNGLSTTPSGSTAAATTNAADLVFAAVAYNSAGGAFTAGGGFTAGGSTATTSGSSDRSLATEYQTQTTTGVKTAAGTLASSTGWAAAVVAYQPPASASAPTVNAGPDQSGINAGATVTLTATGADTGGTIVSYSWSQSSGTAVTLSGTPGAAVRTFTAPLAAAGATLVFSVTATDDHAAISAPDTVTIAVVPAAEQIMLSGAWAPAQAALFTGSTIPPDPVVDPGTLTITVAAEPDHVPPRVRIDVDDSRDTPLSSVTITRRDANGHTYPVRTSDGGPLPLDGGQGTLFDYEMPYGQTVTFSTDVGGGPVAATIVDVADVWMVHTGVPSRSRQVRVVSLPQRTRASARTLYPILGREDPLPISSGARPSAAAALGLRTFTDAERQGLELLLSDDSVVLLNIPAAKPWGWDPCYVSCGDLVEDRTRPFGRFPWREWVLPVQVVGRPGGGTQAALTWNDVAGAYSTWQAIIDAGVTSWAQLAAPTSPAA